MSEPLLHRQARFRRFRGAVDADRVPDLGEQSIKSDARTDGLIQDAGILDQSFESRRHVGVARILAARQCSGVTAKVGQMLSNCLGRGHETLPKTFRTFTEPTRVLQKSSDELEPIARWRVRA